GEVRYGDSATSLTRSTPATARLVPNTTTGIGYDYYQFEAHMTGLSAGATYTYQPFVSGSEVTPAAATFKTAPATGTGEVTFVAFGDSGTGSVEQPLLV